MIRKKLGITGLVMVLTISMIIAPSLLLAFASAPPSYTQLVSASAEQDGGSLKLSIATSGSVPRSPDSYVNSVLVFGYMWVNSNTGAGVVAVIHPSFRDSHQRPDSWHTHTVTVTKGTSSSTFCIASVGTSNGGISIHDGTMKLNISVNQAGGLLASDLTVAAGFVVQSDSGCAATGLGVVVLSTATL